MMIRSLGVAWLPIDAMISVAVISAVVIPAAAISIITAYQ